MKHISHWKSLVGGLLILGSLDSAEAQPHLILQSNHMVVAGGYIKIPGGQITVESGATMTLREPSTTMAASVQIDAGGFVHGCGVLLADVINYGLLAADCGTGTSLTLLGSVTNHGTARASHDSALISSSAPFTNHGTLDFLTGVETLPAMLVNNGTIYQLSTAPAVGMTFEGADVSLTLTVPDGHSYQFQASPDLAADNWINIGSPQVGNNGTLTSTHPNGGTFDRFFYRYIIAD